MSKRVPIAFDWIDGLDFKRIGKHRAKLRRVGADDKDCAGVVFEPLNEARERRRIIATASIWAKL